MPKDPTKPSYHVFFDTQLSEYCMIFDFPKMSKRISTKIVLDADSTDEAQTAAKQIWPTMLEWIEKGLVL